MAADRTAMQASGLDIPKIALSVTFSRDISIPEIVERAFWHSPHVFISKLLPHVNQPARPLVAGLSI